MEDPRIKILSKLEIFSCRVVCSASPIVLLCGGKVNEKARAEDSDPITASLRQAISASQTPYELFRPEEITNWQSDGVFKNLVDFETDLAGICALVVVILESPGAIAELGAFSQLTELSKKLIVIKSDKFTNDTSFINLGILRYISENHESSVKTYPWDSSSPSSISEEMVGDIVEDIKGELFQLTKTEVFKGSSNAHIIVLICELIALFVALKESEVLRYLNELGVVMSKSQLRSKLFLLEQFNLIKKERYSDAVFYLRGREQFRKLRLSFSGGFSVDALRIQTECTEYYSETHAHTHRSRVIRLYNSGKSL